MKSKICIPTHTVQVKLKSANVKIDKILTSRILTTVSLYFLCVVPVSIDAKCRSIKYEGSKVNHVGWRGTLGKSPKWLPLKNIGQCEPIFGKSILGA